MYTLWHDLNFWYITCNDGKTTCLYIEAKATMEEVEDVISFIIKNVK